MTNKRKIVGFSAVICLVLLITACNNPKYQLELLPNSGQGEVKVVSSQEQYRENSEVVLNAQPADGWQFSSWSGTIEGTTNPKTVVVEDDLEVKANFVKTRAMVRGGLSNQGFYHSKELKGEANLEWQSQKDYQVSSSPVVVDDTVYLGSKDEQLYALDAETGEEKWKFATQSRVISTVAVNQDTVYLATAAEDETGTLYAVDAETGEKIWQLKTAGSIYYSAPKFTNNKLYFGDKKGNLYAVNAKSGQVEWEFEAASEIMYSSPAVTEDAVIIGTVDGELYAVNKDDGQKKWMAEVEHPIVSSPVVDGDKIYYVSYRQNTGLLSAVDSNDGSQKWEADFDGPIPYAIAQQDEFIYVGTLAGSLYAVNKNDQTKEWSFAAAGEIIAAPISTESRIYTADSEGNVYGLDRKTGEQKWSFKAQETIVSAPVIAQNRVYFSDQSGTLYCLSGSEEQTQTENEEK